MSASSKKWMIRLGVGSIFVLGAGLAYPFLNGYLREAEYKAIRAEYLNGRLPLLPGPYTNIGNAKDVRFKVVDLGKANTATISENGEVLYRQITEQNGLDLKRGPDYNRIRHRDGKVELLDEELDYCLTSSGHLAAKGNGWSQNKRSFFIFDGKPILEIKPNWGFEKTEVGIYCGSLNACDDGFLDQIPRIDRESGDRTFSFVSPDGVLRTVLAPENFDANRFASSSQLGLFTTVLKYNSLQNTYTCSILNFYKGRFQTMDFPNPGAQSDLISCRDALYSSKGINAFQGSPVKWIYGSYEPQAIPPNCYTASVRAASTSSRCVISTTHIKPLAFGGGLKIPDSDYRIYLVEGQVSYNLREIYRQNGINEKSDLGDNLNGRPMSANGDMLVFDRQSKIPHLYLLLRQ